MVTDKNCDNSLITDLNVFAVYVCFRTLYIYEFKALLCKLLDYQHVQDLVYRIKYQHRIEFVNTTVLVLKIFAAKEIPLVYPYKDFCFIQILPIKMQYLSSPCLFQ